MTDIIGMHWAEDADGIVTLTMDDPTSEANIMNEVFDKALAATVTKLKAEKARIKGVIVTSAKKTFFAGGDLTALIQAKPEHAPMFEQKVAELILVRALNRSSREPIFRQLLSQFKDLLFSESMFHNIYQRRLVLWDFLLKFRLLTIHELLELDQIAPDLGLEVLWPQKLYIDAYD